MPSILSDGGVSVRRLMYISWHKRQLLYSGQLLTPGNILLNDTFPPMVSAVFRKRVELKSVTKEFERRRPVFCLQLVFTISTNFHNFHKIFSLS